MHPKYYLSAQLVRVPYQAEKFVEYHDGLYVHNKIPAYCETCFTIMDNTEHGNNPIFLSSYQILESANQLVNIRALPLNKHNLHFPQRVQEAQCGLRRLAQ